MVLTESGFCGKPMKPFIIIHKKRFSLAQKVPLSNGIS
jgi:hypothetical protein